MSTDSTANNISYESLNEPRALTKRTRVFHAPSPKGFISESTSFHDPRIVTHFPSNGPFRISANKSHGMHRFNDADLTFLVVLGIIVLLLGGLYCFNSKFRGKQESVKSVEQESDLSRREEGNSKVLPSICRAWCSQKFDPFYQCLLPLDTDQLTKQYLHYSRKASKIWQSMCLAEQKHVKNQLVGFALLLFGNSAHENIIKMLGGQLRTIECVEKQARNYGYLN